MLLTLSFLQALSPGFSAPADTVARLFPRLGPAMGLRLESDPIAKRQVLLVQVSRLDPKETLNQIAAATGGVWKPIDGGYRLTFGSPELKRLWAEEAKAREGWIAPALLDERGSWVEASGEDRTILAALVRRLGAESLAALRPGTRRVWSLKPKPGEGLLPPEAADLGRRLAAARLKRIDEAERRGLDLPNPSPLMKPPASFVVAARRGFDADEVGVAFAVFAGDGSRLAGAKGQIHPAVPKADANLASRLPDKPVVFSEDVKGWSAIAAGQAKPGPVGIARYRHPETTDPLAFAVGPALSRIAEVLDTDLVACLPDAAFGESFDKAVAGGISKGLPQRLSAAGLDARLEGDTLIVRPTDRASAIEFRADRSLLRKRIADVEREGHLNFRYFQPDRFEQAYLTALPADLYEDLYPSEWPWGPPLAWNGLNPAQQNQALGAGLPLAQAPGFAARLVGGWEPFAVRTPNEEVMDPVQQAVLESLAQGGLIQARFEDAPLAVVAVRGELFPRTLDFGGVASGLASPQAGPGLRSPETVFYPGVRRRVTLRLLAPGGSLRQEISFELKVRIGETPTRYPNLFPALRSALDKL